MFGASSRTDKRLRLCEDLLLETEFARKILERDLKLLLEKFIELVPEQILTDDDIELVTRCSVAVAQVKEV